MEKERNDHWEVWRKSVAKTGYTPQLAIASKALLLIDQLPPEDIHFLMVSTKERMVANADECRNNSLIES